MYMEVKNLICLWDKCVIKFEIWLEYTLYTGFSPMGLNAVSNVRRPKYVKNGLNILYIQTVTRGCWR